MAMNGKLRNQKTAIKPIAIPASTKNYLGAFRRRLGETDANADKAHRSSKASEGLAAERPKAHP